MFETYIKNRMDEEGEFNFRCTECGECCRDRKDILLTPYDLDRMSRYLKIRREEIIKQYCVVYIGETSHLPIIAVRMDGVPCPFLKNKRCSVQECKPSVCALYPLGRTVLYNKDPDESGADACKIQYFLQPVCCGARDERHTVKEWMAGYHMEDGDAWFFKWQETLILLVEKMNDLIPRLSAGILDELYTALLTGLYLGYDDDRDFLDQFTENTHKIILMLELLKQIDSLGKSDHHT